ncbi:MAG: hypothetical protein U0263_15165 [Polyangiaceae bacterium]
MRTRLWLVGSLLLLSGCGSDERAPSPALGDLAWKGAPETCAPDLDALHRFRDCSYGSGVFGAGSSTNGDSPPTTTT